MTRLTRLGFQGLWPLEYAEKIIAIDVRSSQDYDEDHPAGTLLNDLIKVQQFDEGLRDIQNLDNIFPVISAGANSYYLGKLWKINPS